MAEHERAEKSFDILFIRYNLPPIRSVSRGQSSDLIHFNCLYYEILSIHISSSHLFCLVGSPLFILRCIHTYAPPCLTHLLNELDSPAQAPKFPRRSFGLSLFLLGRCLLWEE